MWDLYILTVPIIHSAQDIRFCLVLWFLAGRLTERHRFWLNQYLTTDQVSTGMGLTYRLEPFTAFRTAVSAQINTLLQAWDTYIPTRAIHNV